MRHRCGKVQWSPGDLAQAPYNEVPPSTHTSRGDLRLILGGVNKTDPDSGISAHGGWGRAQCQTRRGLNGSVHVESNSPTQPTPLPAPEHQKPDLNPTLGKRSEAPSLQRLKRPPEERFTNILTFGNRTKKQAVCLSFPAVKPMASVSAQTSSTPERSCRLQQWYLYLVSAGSPKTSEHCSALL